MGDFLKNRFPRLPNVAGALAAVLLFLYGIAPLTHYREHLRGDCATSVSGASHQAHSTDSVLAASAEDSDNCALCVLQATQSILATVVLVPSFADVPLPVYSVRAASQPVISLFQARRGPPRAPPALV